MKIRLFTLLEAILLVLALIDLVRQPGFLGVVLILAICLMIYSKKRWFFFKILIVILSIITLFFILGNPYIWAFLLVFVIAFVLFIKIPQKPKNFEVVETFYTREASQLMEKEKLSLTSDQIDKPYYFDDININRVVCDDIIDLETTSFIKEENTVLIRKFIGNTKIIVPQDMGLLVDFTSLRGEVELCGDVSFMNKERLRFKSDDYESQEKKLKLIVNVVYGNLTVVRL